MPANQTTAQRNQAFGVKPLGTPFEQLLLKDIGAPDTQGNIAFLNAWMNREGATGFANNPLATMQGGYGGVPGTHGIMSYPSMQQGAAAEGSVLTGGGYNNLLAALRGGNPSLDATYGGDLSKWSGGGYGSLSGANTATPVGQFITNDPAAIASGINRTTGIANAGLEQALAAQNIGYAQQETGFQKQLLGLSQQQLGISRGALARQLALDPQLYGITTREEALQKQSLGLSEKSLQQQRADIARQFGTERASDISAQAGSGTMFTGGGRRQLSDLAANFKSQMLQNTLEQQQNAISQRGLGLQSRQAGLQFREQMAALRDQQKNLDILAQRYGISGQELQARLANTVQNINLGAQQNLNLDFAGVAQSSIGMLQALMQAGSLPLGAVSGGVGGG